MQRYDSYKDSRVKWLGEIPSHWFSASLLYMLRGKISDGPHETPDLKEDGIPFVSIDSLNDTKNIDFSIVKKYISSKDYERYCLKTKLEEGDVLFSKAATIGKTAIVGNEIFMIWSPLAILKPDYNKITTLYLYYIMNCKKAIEEVSMSGSMNTQINVGMRELEKIRIPIPTLIEQEAIANYLDSATSKIDEAIAKQQKMIDLLNERKQIIINNAVTKGLDPNVKMKPSGVDWIGEIPEHWEILPMKHCMKIKNGMDYKHIETEAGIPVIGSGGQFAYASDFLYDGEVVFFGRKGTIDKPLYFKGKFWAVDTMFYAIPQKNINGKYLYYQGMTIPFKYYSTSTALPSMTQTDLGNNPICLPSLFEQNKIVRHLDIEIGKLDKVLEASRRKISLLQERKQIIINDVVTGKVKVV